ncbi:MAG: DUF1934 domain-containing protein [Ruminococcaceae bacterium]|nr:DUF1934 domain-containing protein [Oscillospiraceae bacterium]
MKHKVMLSIVGKQSYQDQEPDSMELVTEGTMEFLDGGWNITYQESELTGLQGVTTTFRVEKDRITLARTGSLRSTMEFQLGKSHDSLYQLDFGALMITVTTRHLFFDILPEGGCIDLVYDIEIEKTEGGTVDYHLDIRRVE